MESYKNGYELYIIKEWRSNYFPYKSIRLLLESSKIENNDVALKFDEKFTEHINIVIKFLNIHVNSLNKDILSVERAWNMLSDEEKLTALSLSEKTIERILRISFSISNQLMQYHQFNAYLISKVGYKIEQYMQNKNIVGDANNESTHWRNFLSYAQFNHFRDLKQKVEAVSQKCTSTYCTIFRSTYPQLARGELEYLKTPEEDMNDILVHIGFKKSVCITLVCI
jgi:hypothetical protein